MILDFNIKFQQKLLVKIANISFQYLLLIQQKALLKLLGNNETLFH